MYLASNLWKALADQPDLDDPSITRTFLDCDGDFLAQCASLSLLNTSSIEWNCDVFPNPAV